MNALKEASIESNRNWKAAGKPRPGPIFEKRQSYRLNYRSKMIENQDLTLTSYWNELYTMPYIYLRKMSRAFGNVGTRSLNVATNVTK